MEEMPCTLPIFIVDAFTTVRFTGNSAAVCIVDFDQILSTEIMQQIAAEMNLSETAFVTPASRNDTFTQGSQFYLRWFSPTCEVPLCGHATLATASVLTNIYENKCQSIEFDTQSGRLVAEKQPDGKITIDLPSYPCHDVDTTKSDFSRLITAVVGVLPIQDVKISSSKKVLIRLGDSVTRRELESLKPDSKELLSCVKNVLGVIVSLSCANKHDCKSENGERYDFLSRYFAPWLGIPEDPVTGSAHAVLAPYWANILGKKKLFARQCSTRGGELHLTVLDKRTIISGDSVVVLQGNITL